MEKTRRVCLVLCLVLCLALIILIMCGSSLGCLEEERAALLKLKASIPIGPLALSTWQGNSSDCCSWEGITCQNTTTTTRRVIELSMTHIQFSSLAWSLNASILLPFQELQVLDLRYSNILGTSPFVFSTDYYGSGLDLLLGFQETLRLKKLVELRIGGNQLKQVPKMDVPSLVVLDLRRNELEDLGHLSGLKLEVLDISFNRVSTDNLSIIWDMTSLRSFTASFNNINSSLSGGFCNLLQLEELDLSNNRFTGSVPPCIGNMTSLIYLLDLHSNQFTGTIPHIFSSLSSLNYISLSSNDLEGTFQLASLANNSNLKVLDLVGNPRLSIDTEDPLYSFLPFQLNIFRVSNCINNRGGVLPTFLTRQNELRLLEVSDCGITGDFPVWLLDNNTELDYLSLKNNFIAGSLNTINPYASYILSWLDLSFNLIQGPVPPSFGYIFQNVNILNMSNNLLQGTLHSSFGTLNRLEYLDLSKNHFFGELPKTFLQASNSLKILKLSDNNFHGQLPFSANTSFHYLETLHLANNQFSGEFSSLVNMTSLVILELSNNLLSGSVPDRIGDLQNLKYLLLSNNSFKGDLPLSFCKLSLEFLELSWNNFGPKIPPCANILLMKYLHFQSTDLRGPFPEFLKGASSMMTLDLRDNGFTGEIPTWVGSLSNLRVLLLQGNHFQGLIPQNLCQLYNISILDLSDNSLSGSIPSCLSELRYGKRNDNFVPLSTLKYGGINYDWEHYFRYEGRFPLRPAVVMCFFNRDNFEEVMFTTKNRLEPFRGTVLEYMSGLDLSFNNLNGSIPPEIGYLSEIHALNLSNNHLTGTIPDTFSNMTQIESLDLSRNDLQGKIPSRMTELYRLAVFSVAHNNLSGKTPERKNQFATFDRMSYEGNPFLCGTPLNSCNATSEPLLPPPQASDHLMEAFLRSFAPTYVVAFLGAIIFLYLNAYYTTLAFDFLSRYVPWFR